MVTARPLASSLSIPAGARTASPVTKLPSSKATAARRAVTVPPPRSSARLYVPARALVPDDGQRLFKEAAMHFAISGTWGPTDPTRAMLPFIFAASAVQAGDRVTLMFVPRCGAAGGRR